MRRMPINNFWLSKKFGCAAALKGSEYFNHAEKDVSGLLRLFVNSNHSVALIKNEQPLYGLMHIQCT